MAEVNPYLLFNGNCKEAFEFYRSVFGGEFARIMKFSEAVGDAAQPASEGDKIMHVSFSLGRGTVLMGSDCPDDRLATVGNNIMLSIAPDTKEEADQYFNGLAAGGTPKQPMQDMFWGAYFGMLTDKFGINWQVNFDYNQPR